MEQTSSQKGASCTASQDIPSLLGNQRFITMFTIACQLSHS